MSTYDVGIVMGSKSDLPIMEKAKDPEKELRMLVKGLLH